MRRLPFLALLAMAALPACGSPSHAPNPDSTTVQTGAARLAAEGFALLDGKRVGLITNHTALVDSVHVIDLLRAAPNVRLVALFGPEHGLRGLADAGAEVGDTRDPVSGIPVFSLYGARRAPARAVLDTLDVLVFDIQDIGARFYTYISTMGLSMQAAAEAGVPFVVLDRPNPLGGFEVEGFVREDAYASFVGQYPIPITHGLTAGELARMIRGEAWLPGVERLDLTVVQMKGWDPGALWPKTGLPWIKTSPNIPDFETALLYPGTCLFEGTAFSEGRGTREPFTTIGGPGVDAEAIASELRNRALPGVSFAPVSFTPESISGMSSDPKLLGKALSGVKISVVDPAAVRPVELGVHLLDVFFRATPERGAFFSERRFDQLAGSARLRTMMERGAAPAEIIAAWKVEVEAFSAAREKYRLY